MTNQEQPIFQSGQSVLSDGWYEAVAVKTPTVSQLSKGEMFPDYDGRAICWHLIKLFEQVEKPNFREIQSMVKRTAQVG